MREKNATITGCGWISPEGGFYGCDIGNFANIAMQIIKKMNMGMIKKSQAEDTLLEEGWIKLLPHGGCQTLGLITPNQRVVMNILFGPASNFEKVHASEKNSKEKSDLRINDWIKNEMKDTKSIHYIPSDEETGSCFSLII